MAKLNAKALGLAMGIIWAAAMILLQVVALSLHMGLKAFITAQRFYLGGYRGTILSSIALVIWSFIYGLVCGALLAWLYNKFLKENK